MLILCALYLIIESDLANFIEEDIMPATVIKEDAYKIIDKLPKTATWDDLIHEIYVRKTIERGLADSKAGRTKDVSTIREKYSLSG